MRWWKGLAALAIGLVVLAGCSKSSSSGDAQLRLLNASVGYPSLDLQVNGVTQTGGASTVAYGAAGSYVTVSTDAITTSVAIAGSSAALSSASRTLSGGTTYTQVAYGAQGALKMALIQENIAAPASGQTSLAVLNLAPDAGSVDLYLGTSNSIGAASLVGSNVQGGAGSSYNTVTAGTYYFWITGNGDTTDVRLSGQSLVLGSGQVVNLILTGSSGGVLVNAIAMVQQSTQSATQNVANSMARLRVVAGVSGNATVATTFGRTTFATMISPNPFSAYTQLEGGTQVPVTLSVKNNPVAVANQSLATGSDSTFLVYGDAAAPKSLLITDDNRLPTNTANAKIRLVNLLNGGAATEALTLVSDVGGTMATGVTQGNASAYFSNLPASTTAHLQVISPVSGLVVDVPSYNILAKGVYSMYVFGDPTANPSTRSWQIVKDR